MKIRASQVGRFESQKQVEVYQRAKALKTKVDGQIKNAAEFDNVAERDLDFLERGRVRFQNQDFAMIIAKRENAKLVKNEKPPADLEPGVEWISENRMNPFIPEEDYTGTVNFDPMSGKVSKAEFTQARQYNMIGGQEKHYEFLASDSSETYIEKKGLIHQTLTVEHESGDWDMSRKLFGFIPLPS